MNHLAHASILKSSPVADLVAIPDCGDRAISSPDLKQMRRLRGISQAQLAHLMAVTQPTISKWERGIEEIPFRSRLRLIDIMQNRKT